MSMWKDGETRSCWKISDLTTYVPGGQLASSWCLEERLRLSDQRLTWLLCGGCTDGEAVEKEEGFLDRQMAISKHIYIKMKEKTLLRVLPAKMCRRVIDRPTRGYAGPWLGM